MLKILEEVKNVLKINWDFENENIKAFIERGKAFLISITDTELDFDSDLNAKALLFDYCRYAYNNALEYFEDNFSKEILRLSLFEAVKESEQ